MAPQKSTETNIVDDVKKIAAPEMIICDPNPFDPVRVSILSIIFIGSFLKKKLKMIILRQWNMKLII